MDTINPEPLGRLLVPTSGVLSRRPNPVPPVVTMQSISPREHHPRIAARIALVSSGTIAKAKQIHCRSWRMSRTVWPDRSYDGSRDAVSLTANYGGGRSGYILETDALRVPVRTATRIGLMMASVQVASEGGASVAWQT